MAQIIRALRPAMIVIRQLGMDFMETYALIASAFRVTSAVDIEALSAHAELRESPVHVPYTKDYDAIDGNHPAQWSERFDTSRWQVFAAFADGLHVGGAVLAPAGSANDDANAEDELWDIRVDPAHRQHGVGHALFQAACDASRARGSAAVLIETQHINVPACRFYVAEGCIVHSINARAYPELPHEVRIVWRKAIYAQLAQSPAP